MFFALWEAGMLGNRTHLWRDPKAAFLSGFPNIGFREIGKPGGKGAWERVPRERVFDTYDVWSGLRRNFVMDSGAPDHKQTLLGEIVRTTRGLEGYMGVAKVPMRVAIDLGLLSPRTGATVKWLLRRYADPASQDDIDALLDLYDGHVVEFACFETNVGVIPGRNTLIWEVRKY